MSFSLTIRNYRNIPYDNPLILKIEKNITFIVGVNNIGKTNLLRFFHELRPVFAGIVHDKFTQSVTWDQELGLTAFSDNLFNQKSRTRELEINLSAEDFQLQVRLNPVRNEEHTNLFTATYSKTHDNLAIDLEVCFRNVVELFSKSHLVPTLRAVSAQGGFTSQAKDTFVGGDFLNQFTTWSTGAVVSKRQQIETFIDELRELFNYRKFDIVVSEDKMCLIVKTDDGSFRLDELGDGIGHFILVLGNALFKQPSLILIDEPEIGLHPKMQELFIRTLASKSKLGLIAASHAIGLARSVADSIYSLTRQHDGKLHLLPFGEHVTPTISQSISEMGYSQFVELGGNNILLVEGRTDIKSFREILRLYGIESKFIIWQLGGGTFITSNASKIIDELNEVKRLNPKSICVIFDSERTAKGQALKPLFEKFKSTCESLGFKVFPTDYHSTENYITQQAIDSILGNTFVALTPYELFGATGSKWPKEKNWLMFREMKKEDFKGTELDSFIQNNLIPLASH
jgi:ABC-type cobalamin/Fe3+-siderophores transport system ATPase subunit